MSPTFQPPAARLVPTVSREPGVDRLANRLMRHFRASYRGQSVLKIAGEYVTVETPTDSQIELATEYYAGGHVYQVSTAVAAALEAAGYEVG